MKYVDSFFHFNLSEGSANLKKSYTKLTETDALEIIRKNCKHFKSIAENGPNIYRGIQSTEDYMLFDPKDLMRKSAQGESNYYTLLIDNSKHWKGYAKRSKSAICTTSYGGAAAYGSDGGSVYYVVPFDDSNVSVCPDSDIWWSFAGTISDDLTNLNGFIDSLFKSLKMSAKDTDFDELKTALSSITEIPAKIKNKFGSHLKTLFDSQKENENLFELIDRQLKPLANGFKTGNYKSMTQYMKGEKEVFTDTKCVMIRKKVYSDFLKWL